VLLNKAYAAQQRPSAISAALYFGVLQRGGQPRRRAMDLAIAATANSADVPLVTRNEAAFKLIDDLVGARSP